MHALLAPIMDHRNNWESIELMGRYYVVGITPISYPCFGVIINIMSKEDNTHNVKIGDIPQCPCLDFAQMSLEVWARKGEGCIAHIYTMC